MQISLFKSFRCCYTHFIAIWEKKDTKHQHPLTTCLSHTFGTGEVCLILRLPKHHCQTINLFRCLEGVFFSVTAFFPFIFQVNFGFLHPRSPDRPEELGFGQAILTYSFKSFITLMISIFPQNFCSFFGRHQCMLLQEFLFWACISLWSHTFIGLWSCAKSRWCRSLRFVRNIP